MALAPEAVPAPRPYTMLYAVISDIHSNLEALSAFLEAADRLRVDRIICLGDIVGYNANPNECIELLRERGAVCVLGNHDSRVAGFEEPHNFNYHAAAAVYWTRNALKPENLEYLRGLPKSFTVKGRFMAVHGWVNDIDRYIMGTRDAERNFELMEGHGAPGICFFGHTHVPATYSEMGGEAVLLHENPLKLAKGVKYLINPGGLGQPRDRDPRAAFLVYDSRKNQAVFHRVEYDIRSASEKVLQAGLPDRLAERLKLGW